MGSPLKKVILEGVVFDQMQYIDFAKVCQRIRIYRVVASLRHRDRHDRLDRRNDANMFAAFFNLIESLRTPPVKKVFFPSLPVNRKLVLWYAGHLVREGSTVEPASRLHEVDDLRKQGASLTFICNHLTYADSHIIEALFLRLGFRDLADHIIHVAGQKTFEISRRVLTRSLNTVRVYQPKAEIDKQLKRKMNLRALKWAAHQKRRGYSLLVFPEGTRTRRHRRFSLHGANPKTTFYFRGSSVVPLGLMGSEMIMPVGRVLPNPSTVRLHVGSPIQHSAIEKKQREENPEASDADLRQRLMTYYMAQINSLLDPEYQFRGD